MRVPTGTITFLFTDIEGSTKLWEDQRQAMAMALAEHDLLLHQAITAHDGIVFKTMGDAFCAAFASAPAALSAALTAQKSLLAKPWSDEIRLSVRMALHTGLADERDGEYLGPPLNRVSRLLSAAHGGQILLSLAAHELTRDQLPPECSVRDLGSHSLRDLSRPEQVYQLLHPALRSQFPPLKSLDSPDLPNNLPQQVTSFVGREKELSQMKALLAKSRLLTLIGSGGSGKTRLSLQAAADVLENYANGVWLVELAHITEPSLIPEAIANVLGSVACAQDDFAYSGALLRESLILNRELGNNRGIAYNLEGIARLSAAQGDAERAAVRWGAAEALRDVMGTSLLTLDSSGYAHVVADVREKLGEHKFASAWAEGRELSLDQVIKD